MKIQFEDIGFVYSALNSVDKSLADNSESWKANQVDPDVERVRSTAEVRYRPASLPSPLHSGGLIVSRKDNVYQATFVLEARKAEIFRNSSGRLVQQFAEREEIYIPTSNNATGYLLDANNQPFIGVFDVNNDEVRLICMGSHGAVQRQFRDLETFERELKRLEQITNVFVNGVIPSCANSPEFKDLTVYLSV